MNTFLITITLLSLGFALVLLALNWSGRRDERRRSAARVQALVEAAAEAGIQVATAPMKDPAADTSLQVARSAGAEPVAVSQHELFQTTAEPPPSFRRLGLPISLGVAIVGTILSGLAVWSHDRPARPASGPAAVAAVDPSVPLELIALRHLRTVDGLSITGLVRNPSGGHRISDVNVLVFLFDRNGALLTSVRAPLDFRTLAPGDESPFVVSLDKIGTIGRYRVGFRAADKVVPHVDRRQSPVVAVASSS